MEAFRPVKVVMASSNISATKILAPTPIELAEEMAIILYFSVSAPPDKSPLFCCAYFTVKAYFTVAFTVVKLPFWAYT